VNGWLLAQLPRVMSSNDVVRGFVGAAEGTSNSIRSQLDVLEYQLDTHLASPEMLRYLAAWLGFPLDRMDSPDLHRPLLRALGEVLPRRGTKGSLEKLLVALTGGSATVTETGGVFGPGERVPASRPVVRVELSRVGPIGPRRLRAILERELPIGVQLEVVPPAGSSQSEVPG
jgi:phage tail-like protein